MKVMSYAGKWPKVNFQMQVICSKSLKQMISNLQKNDKNQNKKQQLKITQK